jgi:subtilisin family serine protease
VHPPLSGGICDATFRRPPFVSTLGLMMRLLLTALATLALMGGVSGAAVQPDDPAWADQLGARQIGLPQVWETTTGDPSVVIATVDTGANVIPDLQDAFVPGYDFVDNDYEPQDTHGHGSRVASVIAARGNNEIGMAGHCWGCRVMPIRVSGNGSASPGRIAAGIRYAVDQGARIINVSLSHPGSPDAAEAAAVKYAIDRDVVVVASAGNAGTETPQYPGAYPGVLAVGATDDLDALYFWSSFGAWVSLTAPGCQMVEDWITPPGTICGTSFTPAVVSAVAGLILSRNPSLTGSQVVAALRVTARPVVGVAYGRVDAVAAFRWLGLLTPSSTPTAAPPPPPAVARPRVPTPAPGQRFTRQTLFETGTFKRGFRSTFRVGRGRFEMQLLTPLASSCSLSLNSASELTVAAPAVKNLISLSVRVTAGRYTAEVQCRGARTRQYSLGVIAMFPRVSP